MGESKLKLEEASDELREEFKRIDAVNSIFSFSFPEADLFITEH